MNIYIITTKDMQISENPAFKPKDIGTHLFYYHFHYFCQGKTWHDLLTRHNELSRFIDDSEDEDFVDLYGSHASDKGLIKLQFANIIDFKDNSLKKRLIPQIVPQEFRTIYHFAGNESHCFLYRCKTLTMNCHGFLSALLTDCLGILDKLIEKQEINLYCCVHDEDIELSREMILLGDEIKSCSSKALDYFLLNHNEQIVFRRLATFKHTYSALHTKVQALSSIADESDLMVWGTSTFGHSNSLGENKQEFWSKLLQMI